MQAAFENHMIIVEYPGILSPNLIELACKIAEISMFIQTDPELRLC